MAEDERSSAPPLRLMSFVSQQELDHAKETRGERVEDGTAQRDRPLYEILKENKDKKDAEFNERFKHRPPKALDEDEMEFLDKLEMSRKEYERQVATEEAEQLRSFQEAVAARSSIVHEIKETSISGPEEIGPVDKKTQRARPLGCLTVSVKPQKKKAKTESNEENLASVSNGRLEGKPSKLVPRSLASLVTYSDESDDENQ